MMQPCFLDSTFGFDMNSTVEINKRKTSVMAFVIFVHINQSGVVDGIRKDRGLLMAFSCHALFFSEKGAYESLNIHQFNSFCRIVCTSRHLALWT